MIRRCRRFVPGIPVHVVLYGLHRRACFYYEEDYQLYLDQLAVVLKRNNISLHAYVLMSNHVHLLLTQHNDNGIDSALRFHSKQYADCIRKNYKISEVIWQKNYKASYIKPESHLIKVYQFIELNPVRSGLVDCAQEYSWSSYAFRALNEKNTLIKEHTVFHAFTKNKIKSSQLYLKLCQEGLSEKEVLEIKAAIQNEISMGDKSFNDYIQMYLLGIKGDDKQEENPVSQETLCQ